MTRMENWTELQENFRAIQLLDSTFINMYDAAGFNYLAWTLPPLVWPKLKRMF